MWPASSLTWAHAGHHLAVLQFSCAVLMDNRTTGTHCLILLCSQGRATLSTPLRFPTQHHLPSGWNRQKRWSRNPQSGHLYITNKACHAVIIVSDGSVFRASPAPWAAHLQAPHTPRQTVPQAASVKQCLPSHHCEQDSSEFHSQFPLFLAK